MSEDFWKLVEEYQQLGFDPLRWVPSCSNEVDTDTLEHSLNEVKRTNIKLTPSWFDSFYYMDGKIPEITRRVYNFDNLVIEKEVEIKRALSIFRIHTVLGYNPGLLSTAIQKFFKSFRSRVFIKKNTMALTSHPEAQFALFDYIELHRGDKVGYTCANNSVTQVTDPTLKPESEIHSNIALTSGMEYLSLLGCTTGFKLFPVYDAPTDQMLDEIRTNLDSFTSRYNISMEDYSSIKIGNLFFGTTAMANTVKELPTRYDQVEEGMQIIISNKMGSMPAISLYMLTQMDNDNIHKFEQNGISFDILSAAKDGALKNLSEPHFSLGRIISRYCPDFGTKYDKNMHITAVHPVGADGFFAIIRLAELTNSHIVIRELPMENEELNRFATRELLIENSTASSNGCHLIVATKDVTGSVVDDLRRHNFEPTVIGFFSKKERPSVTTGPDIDQYIASKSKLAKVMSIAQKEH
jgi:selenophosphate synthase